MKKLILLIALLGSIAISSSAEGKTIPDSKEVTCLAKMIYHEARGEGDKGMVAVAYVAINRQKEEGENICSIVRKPHQFNGMEKEREYIQEPAIYEKAYSLAYLSLSGVIKDTTNGATYFHEKSIKPTWSYIKTQCAFIGNHIFYK